MTTAGPTDSGRRSSTDTPRTVHATCLVLGEDGVLLMGPSGSGKSSLCLDLLDEADRDGRHARLVGDDRIALTIRNGRLIGRPHPELRGLIEIRGASLRRLPRTAEAAVIRLVVDLAEERPRLPEDEEAETDMLGVRLPLLRLEPRQPRKYLIRERLAALRHSGGLGSRVAASVSS